MKKTIHFYVFSFLLFSCVSHFACFNAAPLARTRNLVHHHHHHQFQGSNNQASGKNSLLPQSSNWEQIQTEEGNTMKMETAQRRIEIELHDYPGTGANNRHTPTKHQEKDRN